MENNLGSLRKEKEGFKIVFERHFQHSIETVWDAITNPEKLKIWFTDVELELKADSPMNIIFRDEAKSVSKGYVIEVSAPHKFVWSWETELAVWELSETGAESCKLIFTYSRMEDKYAVGAAGGFHAILDRLCDFLQGSKKTYPFGTEEFDPDQVAKREMYGTIVYDTFPELEKYHPVKMERIFKLPARNVWDALTDNEQMKKWYFDFKGNFKTEVGHVFEWEAGPPNGKKWLHRGKILEVETGKKLVHSWEFPGYEGEAKLTWELEETPEKETKLNLRFDFIKPFDPKVETLRRKNFAEGWKQFMNFELEEFLSKQK